MNRNQASTLYVCHTISTWNARSYEFAAVLFTAAAFPEGLRAASFVGIATSLGAIIFGSSIGRLIDQATSRLRTLITTILVNRLITIVACFLWFLIVPGSRQDAAETDSHNAPPSLPSSVVQGTSKPVIFSILLIVAVVESLSRRANAISIERDWVPTLADPSVLEGYTLTHVNAVMARIDVGCKLLAPIAVSQFMTLVTSTRAAVFVLACVNILSIGFELWTAQQLWRSSPALRDKEVKQGGTNGLSGNHFHVRLMVSVVTSTVIGIVDNIRVYFGTTVWVPSLSICLTQASILSISGVTVVFLLDSGYSMQLVTIAEFVSAVFELSSTFVVPLAVGQMMRTNVTESMQPLTSFVERDDADEVDDEQTRQESSQGVIETIISRVGFHGILWMALILLPTVPILLYLTGSLTYPIARSKDATIEPTFYAFPIATLLLLFCFAASRLGRGTIFLAAQQLAQSKVAPHQRAIFAGVELSIANIFGLLHNLGSAIWSDPRQFWVLATGSWIAIGCSALLYSVWIRSGYSKLSAI